MANILFLIAQEGFQDIELSDSKNELESKGHNCSIASLQDDICTGKYGEMIAADLGVDLVVVDDYDCIVVIGGPGTSSLASSDKVISILNEASGKGKLIAAICIAPAIVLSKTSILNGKNATCFQTPDGSSKKELESAGATFVDKPVVVDGKLITANGPDAAREFGISICDNIL